MGLVSWLQKLFQSNSVRDQVKQDIKRARQQTTSSAQPLSLVGPAVSAHTELHIKLDADQLSAIEAINGPWDTEALFVCGGAGTGKSTVVREVVKRHPGKCMVVAPTGIAALNIGGATIHSQMRLPSAPIILSDKVLRPLAPSAREAICQAHLIIVDEVSMVRADILDALAWRLREATGIKNHCFGGKKVLLVGDLQQLEPVVDDNARRILEPRLGKDLFFFNASVWKHASLRVLRLGVPHRQENDQQFAQALNELRSSPTTAIESLAQMVQINGSPNAGTILTITKDKASHVNNYRLDQLPTKAREYKAHRSARWPTDSEPAPHNLSLKVGARVMITVNDQGPKRLYVNGTIAIVLAMNRSYVTVKTETGMVIPIERHTWDYSVYTVDKVTKTLTLKSIATFEQVPLKLAWAITIHKAQGLTLDRVHVDNNGNFFASGQAYVAMTRCRTADGLSLTIPLAPNMFGWSSGLIDWMKLIEREPVWTRITLTEHRH